MPRARSSRLVVSAMIACAVPMFPPVAPSRRRDAKSSGERVGEGEEKVADHGSRQGEEDHGAPPEAVREAPENGREKELHRRIARHEESERERRRVVLLGVERQQRE